jgi:hypothetical protein
VGINIKEKFAKLSMLAINANKLRFNGGVEYVGPVKPVGFIMQTDNRTGRSRKYLVIAEDVPLKYTLGNPDGSEPYPTGVVLAAVNDDYEFMDWNPESKTLGMLFAIHWCSDGTVESACTESSGKNFTFQVLFRTAG